MEHALQLGGGAHSRHFLAKASPLPLLMTAGLAADVFIAIFFDMALDSSRDSTL